MILIIYAINNICKTTINNKIKMFQKEEKIQLPDYITCMTNVKQMIKIKF